MCISGCHLADHWGRAPAWPARADRQRTPDQEGVSFSVGRGSVSPVAWHVRL